MASGAVLAACSTQTPAPADNTGIPSSDQEESTPSPADTTDTGSADNTTAGTDQGEPRVIAMTVTDWEFSQKEIRLKKGEKVTVRLTGVEGDHSFMANDLGLNVAVEPGETKDFTIPTDTTGTFGFRCGIPCGPGHRDMTGQIIIE